MRAAPRPEAGPEKSRPGRISRAGKLVAGLTDFSRDWLRDLTPAPSRRGDVPKNGKDL